MKRVLLSTFMAVLSLAATAQTAQTEEGTSVQVPRPPIELPTQSYSASAVDFDHYKGGYDLSNGDTMVLRSQGPHMYALVGDRPQVELVAAAPNVFVAVDRQLKMTFEDSISGQIRGELLMAAQRQLAQENSSGGERVSFLAGR